MRVIDAFDGPVRAVAVSPDGRFVATGGSELGFWDVVTGQPVGRSLPWAAHQVAFTPDGSHVLFVSNGLCRLGVGLDEPEVVARGQFSGGVAVAPDGKTLVATRAGRRQEVRLERFSLPDWQLVTGFDFWSPFTRLAFSPNGEFLAGIGGDSFELRIAVTGGLNGRHRVYYLGEGFQAFAPDSRTVVFGWETDLHVMETRNGNVARRVTSPGSPFLDAAFLGSGRLLATVDGSPVVRLWSSESWEVVGGYDWGCGGLTCVVPTADGLAAVCGTETGRLVVFDVDE